jgi:hypothetical protein
MENAIFPTCGFPNTGKHQPTRAKTMVINKVNWQSQGRGFDPHQLHQ